MNWQTGRQHTGYLKALLAQGKTWDCWLIKYQPGTYIPTHTDPVVGKRHYRINIRLTGEDTYVGDALFRWWRIVVFRPDIMLHSVSLVTQTRLVLSIGWVR